MAEANTEGTALMSGLIGVIATERNTNALRVYAVIGERLGDKYNCTDTHGIDDMVDVEMFRQKTDFVRVSMKNSVRT